MTDQYLIFSNPGELDSRCITIQGVNVKPNSDSPIGRFGTGLKFGIATMLRLGCEITIYSGLRKFEFTSETEAIRGKDFQLIYMGISEVNANTDSGWEETQRPAPLAFTTDLGRHWEAWMAYREFWSNAKDEGGLTQLVEQVPDAEADWTFVVVSGAPMLEAHEKRGEFLLERSDEPIWAGCGVEVYAGTSSSVFYQGLKVYTHKTQSMFTYNITSHIDLTEDRTVKSHYELDFKLGRALLQWNGPETPLRALLADHHHYEAKLDWNWVHSDKPSRVFLATVADMRRKDQLAKDHATVKIGRGYDSTEFVYVESPLNAEEAKIVEEVKGNLGLLGFSTKFILGISEDIEPEDEKQIQDGKLLLAPSVLAEGAWSVTKLCVPILLRHFKDMSWNEQKDWFMEEWMVGKGVERPLVVAPAEDEPQGIEWPARIIMVDRDTGDEVPF